MPDTVELKERLEALLEELDVLLTDREPEAAEALEELNAEYEDALMLLDSIGKDSDDSEEELSDALEEFRALAADYRALAGRVDGLELLAERLEAAVDFT
ncbi:MAG: hypothetical protein IJ124_14760 [Clostridia bacterium]|nr:hypothetical protein [Clostridia bacterium]